MSKKDFIALADHIIVANRSEYCRFSSANLTTLANFCQEQNPNFKRERWFGYIDGDCGKSGGKVKVSKDDADQFKRDESDYHTGRA